MDFHGVNYTSEAKLFKNLATFDFESFCVQQKTFKDTITATWIGKHVPNSVSISSILMEEQILLCNFDPHHIIATFIGSLERLGLQSKTQLNFLVPDVETRIKDLTIFKMRSHLEKLNQRHNRREQISLDDRNNKRCASTQVLRIQNNHFLIRRSIWNDILMYLSLFGSNSRRWSQFFQILFATLFC